ncbi:uncharacterized protein LOC129592070 [Paramacrobiotus metropolitanus]|uniref:uncharacterized protein LOC129592070 n=1 Tax=Paramacrobiotus metropolitanus TaxID=2943436 RepID=UPI002445D4F9|nr:uncharacterized protein LOC129592070 [Paramacrobiotus metropolitanus]
MKSILAIALFVIACAGLGEAYFSGALKPVLKDALLEMRQEVYQAFNTDARSDNNKVAEFVAALVDEEGNKRVQLFENYVQEYEKMTQEANAMLHKATEPLRNPPMEKINYAALVAEEVIGLMPKIKELNAHAQVALDKAKNIAIDFTRMSMFNAVSARMVDLQSRGLLGWIADVITGGPTWIINNLATLAATIMPDSALSIYFVQTIAQTIVDNLASLGSTITEAAAVNLLAFLGPFKEPLGDLYDQIVFSLQQTFPWIFK